MPIDMEKEGQNYGFVIVEFEDSDKAEEELGKLDSMVIMQKKVTARYFSPKFDLS